MASYQCHYDVMDLAPFVHGLRSDLAAAAAAGGPDVAAAAERLALALEPAVRLTLMEALSQAAAEITADLAAGSVDLRLAGREPRFVVDAGAHEPPGAEAPFQRAQDEADDDDRTTARITLRLPEALKAKAEDLAAGMGLSLNSWLVQAVRAATRERGLDIHLSGLHPTQPAVRRGAWPRRMTGWV
jgi:hypothetical protein